jgi:hypothetical protein
VLLSLEQIQMFRENPISPTSLSWIMGTVELIITLLYSSIFLFPKWADKVSGPIHTATPDPLTGSFYWTLFAVAFACALHTYTQVWLMGHTAHASIFTSLLHALSIAGLLTYWNLSLCDAGSTCLEPAQGVGAIFVLIGGSLFARQWDDAHNMREEEEKGLLQDGMDASLDFF